MNDNTSQNSEPVSIHMHGDQSECACIVLFWGLCFASFSMQDASGAHINVSRNIPKSTERLITIKVSCVHSCMFADKLLDLYAQLLCIHTCGFLREHTLKFIT